MDTARLEQPATSQRGPVRRGTVVDSLSPPQKRRLRLQRTAVRQSLILSGGFEDSLWSEGLLAAPRAAEPPRAGQACCDVAVQTEAAFVGVFDAAPGTWAPSPAFHWNVAAEPFLPEADAAVYIDDLLACELGTLCADSLCKFKQEEELKEELEEEGAALRSKELGGLGQRLDALLAGQELGTASSEREPLKERLEGLSLRLDVLQAVRDTLLRRCGGQGQKCQELAAATEECEALRQQFAGTYQEPEPDPPKPRVVPCVKFMEPLVEEVSLCAEASGSKEEDDDEAADREAVRERPQQVQEEAEEFKRLGNELYKRKRFEEALTMYNKAIQKEPHDLIYHNNRCAVLMEMSARKYVTVIATCTALIVQRHVFNSINPGGASHEKVAKVQNWLASAVSKHLSRELVKKGFKAWAASAVG